MFKAAPKQRAQIALPKEITDAVEEKIANYNYNLYSEDAYNDIPVPVLEKLSQRYASDLYDIAWRAYLKNKFSEVSEQKAPVASGCSPWYK